MAYSSNDLAQIQAAIARGVLRVRMNGEEIQYTSISEMLRVEAKIKRELGLSKKQRVFNPTTNSGWR